MIEMLRFTCNIRQHIALNRNRKKNWNKKKLFPAWMALMQDWRNRPESNSAWVTSNGLRKFVSFGQVASGAFNRLGWEYIGINNDLSDFGNAKSDVQMRTRVSRKEVHIHFSLVTFDSWCIHIYDFNGAFPLEFPMEWFSGWLRHQNWHNAIERMPVDSLLCSVEGELRHFTAHENEQRIGRLRVDCID